MTERKFMFMNPDYGYHEESDPTTDTISLAGLTMAGNIGMGTHSITGLADPLNAQEAATKAYVDNVASGLMWKPPVLVLNMVSDADQGAADPTGMSTGDCYVVDNWATQADGDIVEWSGTAWVVIQAATATEPANGTRVIVKATGAAGSFTGHANKVGTYDATLNTWSFAVPEDGWAALVNGDGGIWSDTAWTYNGTAWVQFSGTGQINAGAGLTKTGNTLNVGKGDGIAVGADDVAVDLYATNPGLTLVGTSPNKKLSVLTDGAHGVITGASGVELEIDATPGTLKVDADGLGVTGLPLLFTINDSAVTVNVSATNLNTLTAGPTSNADALHTHSGSDEAKRIEATHLNNATVTAGRAVRWSATANEVIHADNATAAGARTIGVARTGGLVNPGTSEVVKYGVCTGVLSSATVNTPYFLGTAGALVLLASVPNPGQVVRMGYAVNGTDLDVQIQDYGKKL
jgi:hypothetical protein